jgi:hypothetical protein
MGGLLSQKDMRNPDNSEIIFAVTGAVETMYITDGTMNLLSGMRDKMAAAGMAAIFDEMVGTATSTSMISTYEGESVQHFACYIGERMIIGTFENIGFIEGEEVTMLVNQVDDKVLFAHAVVRIRDSMLWMPHSIAKGRLKVAQWIAVLFFWLMVFAFCLLGSFSIFTPIKEGFLHFFFWRMIPAMIVVAMLVGGGAFWSSLADARHAERLLRLLGFKNPWRVNLSPYSEARLGTGGSYQVYDLRKALHAYGSLNELTPPQSTTER